MAKKYELYTESKKQFDIAEETIGFCNWESYHDNFKLECWNMYNDKGQPQVTIIQFWQNGAGYTRYGML